MTSVRGHIHDDAGLAFDHIRQNFACEIELVEKIAFEDEGELVFGDVHERIHDASALVDPVVVKDVDCAPVLEGLVDCCVDALAIEQVES